MRALSPGQVEEIFTAPKFTVACDGYRSALLLAPDIAGTQTRIAAGLPDKTAALTSFARTLNRWLPSGAGRLLWAEHWETRNHGSHDDALVAAAWRGMGETRALTEAPGLYLEKQDWDEQDQTLIPPDHAQALGLLTGVMVVMMVTHSDGWLIAADCADRIEFWEGHFFFHSADPMQIQNANEIVDAFGCVRWKG